MSDWVTDTLGNLVDFQKGRKVNTSPFRLAGYDRYLGAASLGGRHDGYASTFLSVQATENDVLMLWDGERSGLVGHNLKGVVSSTVSKLSPKGLITSDLLYYFLLHNFEWIQNRRTGTGVPHVPKDLSRILKLRFPSDPDIQNKIARMLSTIDEAIERTEALIGKYEQIKAGMMHDLFTRGLTADGQLRPPRDQAPDLYQQTPIGWLPKEWEAKKLGTILQESGGYLQTGPFGSQLHAHEYQHEGIPVVMPQDVNDGKISICNIARISEERARILHRHRLKIDDIIIARRGELSRAAPITENEKAWVCGTGCFLLRLGGSKLNARFISYVYRHDLVQRQVAGLAVGTTMPSLNNSVMSALYFPCLGIDEQHRISSRLEIAEKQIATMDKVRIKLVKQKTGLMHDLLTGKVPVTVDEGKVANV